jgi:tetratricopeptide (TPR) repeat protein
MKRLLVALLPLVLTAPCPASAQHDAHKLGAVSFPTSCDAKVQAQFESGLAMLHSYWFGQARKTFEAVLQQDPSCAMAYWGIALDLLGNTLVAPPTRANAQSAWDALEKGRAIGAKTQRERDWIEALSAYFKDHDKVPVDVRLRAYDQAMAKLTERYPDDFEAWVFYALTLQASAAPSDRTYSNQLKSAAILEKLVKQNPDHPGAVHFLIHAYDYPSLAEKGLPAAKRYADIAPAAPHARHMPSHIYSMVGMWEESVASNLSSIEVAPTYVHAYDFIVYAHMQLAQDAKAKAAAEKAAAAARSGASIPGSALGAHTALASMPARLMLESANWKGAAALAVYESPIAAANSLNRFARGLGMARSGDPASAKGEIDAIKALRATLEKAGDSYWAGRSEEHVLAVSAWVSHAQGKRDEALKFMRAAADLEDARVKHVAMENEIYPMRELLGELLLETGQPKAALAEFETSLKATPNRYRGLWGAARAADAAGDRTKAAGYFAKVVELAANADTTRPEIALARAQVTRR